MKLPSLYLSVWKRKKKNRFCVHIYFLFSVQLIAAVYPFMSNHQCLYPHIPMPGSYNNPVSVCFMAEPQTVCRFPVYFHSSNQSAGVHCSTKPHFLSFCHVLYLPVSDAFIPLTHPLFLSQFLYYCFFLSLSHSIRLTYQEASNVCADVLSWLLFQLALAAFALSATVLLSFWGSDAAAQYCFCLKCLSPLVYLFVHVVHLTVPPH